MKIALMVIAILVVLAVIYFVTSYTIRKKHYQTINELMQKISELINNSAGQSIPIHRDGPKFEIEEKAMRNLLDFTFTKKTGSTRGATGLQKK